MTMLKTRACSKHILIGKIYKVSQNFMSRQSPGNSPLNKWMLFITSITFPRANNSTDIIVNTFISGFILPDSEIIFLDSQIWTPDKAESLLCPPWARISLSIPQLHLHCNSNFKKHFKGIKRNYNQGLNYYKVIKGRI